MPRTISVDLPDDGEVFAIAYDTASDDYSVGCVDSDYSVITGPRHKLDSLQNYGNGTVQLVIKPHR